MPPRRVFALLYFFSGATGLLYQVVWSRALTLEMGHTAAAVSTVLAAFMGGLALGAALGGRRAVHVDGVTALRWYAGLEAAVAIAALLVAPALSLASPLLAAAYRDGTGGLGFVLLRLGLSLVVVALPATAMGATFPFAVRWLETQAPGAAGRLAGRLYALNTLGAALGASLTGFVLLPALGLTRTTLAGVTINALVALIAWRLPRGSAPSPEPARTQPPTSTRSPAAGARSRRAEKGAQATRRRNPGAAAAVEAPAPRAASIALFVSGLAALIHEVAWTRVLALVIGPTTYAFTTMVTAFIVGLAAGGALGVALLRRGRSPLRLLAWAQALAAVSALGAAAAVPRLPLLIASLVGASLVGTSPVGASPVGDGGERYLAVLLTESVVVFLLLFPLTLALGASFPLAVAAADAGGDSAARPTARVYAWNTVGAIVGALVGGFVLLPQLGLQGAIGAAAVLGLCVAVGLALSSPPLRSSRWPIAAVAAGAAVALWRTPAWSHTLLSAGLYRQAQASFDPLVEVAAGSLLYYGDGPTGTVSVRRVAGEVSLAINGKVDASNAGDMLTQKLLAHLPLLLHPAPRDIGIIGLGSGVTAGAALTHRVASVDTIELSPEVVQASRFFDADSHRPLADTRSRLIVGDGRTHLRLGRRTYDAIISEPSNPWMAGVAPLFTREMFEAARDRLRPGGVFCQWAHTYQMSEADLASIAATFLAAFPDGSMWLVGDADALLIGTRDGVIAERVAGLERRWQASADARRDLERVHARDAASLLALHVADGSTLAAFAGAAPVQTDDRTALEFSAPLTLYARTGRALVDRLRTLATASRQPPAVAAALGIDDAASWRQRAEMYLAAEAYGPAFDAASRALALDPGSSAADVLVKAAVPLNRTDAVMATLAQIAGQPQAALAARVALSRLRATRGDLEGAIRTAADAVDAHPESPAAWEQLASVLGDVADPDRLATAVTELTRRTPNGWAAAYYAATVAFLRGDFAGAAALGERAAGLQASDGRALNLVGAARASLGDVANARRAFEASLDRDARDPASYVNLARLELGAGNAARAAALFSEALVLDPASREARDGLDSAQHLR